MTTAAAIVLAPAAWAQTPPSDAAPALSPAAPELPAREPQVQVDIDEVLFQRSAPAYYVSNPNGSSLTVQGHAYTYASTVLGASYRIEDLELEGKLPFLVFDVDDGHSGAPIVAGNVELGGSYVKTAHDYEMKIGALFTLPTAPKPGITLYGDQIVIQPDYSPQAAWSRGWDRFWLWPPRMFTPFAPSFRIGSRRDAVFQHATELVVAPLIAADPGQSTVPLIIQLSEDLGARIGVVRLGTRAELVANVTATPSRGQFSVLPYAGVDTGAFFADAGALFNTQDPVRMGASVDGQVSWSMRLRGGARF